MSEQPTSAEEKVKILKEMQQNFLTLSEEYKLERSKVEEKVKERDERIKAITQEQEKI